MTDKPAESSGSAAKPMSTTPGETSTPAATVVVKEEKTQPFRLRELAAKMAQRRRRTTAAELTFKRGKGSEVRVPLERTETVIGRDPVCDIVLSEKAASARHARIRRGPGGFYELEDLGSTNGVFVDGERVERMTLLDGDTFQIGDTRFAILVAPVVGEEG
ncbi:MAG: FHA domain-containing protein [Deltaproteobacteria bacterium]|nr:FHA domain-containing protein [Deltaproteobacteria bacterium]